DAPPGVDVLGLDVWCGNLPPEHRGFVALGADLLRKLMQLPDVQCAWLLLAFCAAPRTQHLLHNVPPADILPYARGHDDAVWAVVEGLLGDQCLGLLAAERVSPAAYWAAWADALPVLRQRCTPACCGGLNEQTGVGVLRTRRRAAFGCPCPSRPCTVALKADTDVGLRRGFVVERAWVQVAREAVGPYGRVVPQ
ncbi:unnamed protein product, partial [Symbiodinium necroappetens]